MVTFSRSTLRRLGVDIYPGEGRAAVLLFLAFFLCITFDYATKSVRQATFVDTLGAKNLPYVFLLVALSSYPLLRLYARFADRVARQHLIAITCTVIAISLAVFWWLYRFPWAWVPVAFYVWISIAFAMIVSQLWTFANHILDPRQAKRLFGFIGAGGVLGGAAGGQVARLATELVGTRYALLVAALLLVGLAALIYQIRPLPGGGSGKRPVEDKAAKARGGLEVIRGSRHLQLIAALLVLGVVVSQIVELQFNWAVETATGDLDERTVFFGNFYSVMGVAAFLFQILFTSRIHRVLGVGFALKVLPVTVALGTGSVLVAALVLPAVLVPAALALKIGESGLRYSLDQSTRELLFLPVPSAARVKAKAFIDVLLQRSAKGLAALVLLPVALGLLTPLEAGWMTLVVVALWLTVAAVAAREYVRAFSEGLERRTVDSEIPINLSDVTTLEILVQSLGSSDARQVLHSLDLLAAHTRSHLVPPLLLYHDDAEVRLRTLQILAEADRQDALLLIERRLSDESPDVRAEAIRVLAALQHRDAAAIMLPRLHESDPGVRAAAVACLATRGDEELAQRAGVELRDLLSDAEPGIRVEAAKAIGAIPEPAFQAELMQVLYDADPRVIRAGIAAVRRRVGRNGPNPLYLPTLVSLLGRRRLKHEARDALIAFGEAAIPALLHFMGSADEPLWVRRAIPKAIAAVGTPAAISALIDSLGDTSDAFLRRKLVEALGALDIERQLTAGERTEIEIQIARECEGYLGALVDLCGLEGPATTGLAGPRIENRDDMSLLENLLAERMDDHLKNLFGLLALLHPPAHIWGAYYGFTNPRSSRRGHALEYLDNTLSGEVRQRVFAVIGDSPLRDRLEQAKALFALAPETKIETLRRMFTHHGDGDDDATFLACASLYMVHTDRVSELLGEIETLQCEAAASFVEETAGWVAEKEREG